jgi:hypothetical protein
LRLEVKQHMYSDQDFETPVAQLLPDHLEQLRIKGVDYDMYIMFNCAALTAFTSLRRLVLSHTFLADPEQLLLMPGLVELDLQHPVFFREDGGMLEYVMAEWGIPGHCSAPQHLTKLMRLSISCRQSGPLIPAPFIVAVPGLQKLEVYLHGRGAAAGVQQLPGLSRLQHLSLWFGEGRDVAAVLSSLSAASQLTCLRVRVGLWHKVGHRTWRGLLPHLTQLRVLVVDQPQVLDQGLAAEVYRLRQLQCLYVAGRVWKHGQPSTGPPATCAALARHLPALSECSSLRAVLCWSRDEPGRSKYYKDQEQPALEYVHEGRLHLTCWHKWELAAEEGRVVCPRACPHLPGVWELEQQEAADG